MRNIRLGDFRLDVLLGKGGMGSVWRARFEARRNDSRPPARTADVAIKVMTTQRARDPLWRNAFATEIRAVARLRHPNIPMILDFGEVSRSVSLASEGTLATGSPWLAMEMCGGGSLARRAGSLEWADTKALLLALLDALAHAHAKGIIHRDLKPANVLFDGPEDIPKLADFGLAVDIQTPSHDPSKDFVVGTPSSMAPEQFDGRTRDFGPWTDLYGLGCLAHRLVCGRHPYALRQIEALREAHRTWPLPRLTPRMSTPPGLEAWVHALLAKDHTQRFQLASDARSALLELDTAGTSAPTGDGWRARSRTRVHPRHPIGLPLFGIRPIPFVGRTSQRDELWRLLRSATSDNGHRVAALIGPAGAGKSRLATWLTETAHERGLASSIRAIHGTDPNEAHGIDAALRNALGTSRLGLRDILDRLTTRWRDRVPLPTMYALARTLCTTHDHADPAVVSTEAERHALLQIAIAQESESRPVILVLEDVHASMDAIRFVETILNTPAPQPVLIVLTARSEDLAVRDLEREALDSLLDSPHATRIPVPPLEADDANSFVGEMIGFRADLQGRVAQRIQGNPLFAVQLVADWVARGVLVHDAEGYHLKDGSQLPLPKSLRDAWDARLQTFLADRPAHHEVALEAAAILGGPIADREWAAVCEEVHAPPGALRRDLLDVGLAVAHETEWDLVHGMLREALHERAKAAHRWSDLHAACARVLGAISNDQTRLGRHLLASGATEQALPKLMAGLEADMRAGNLARAEETSHQIQHSLSGGEPSVRLVGMTTLHRARLAGLRGRIHAANRELAWCDEHLRPHEHPDLAARAATEAALVAYRAGDLERTIERATAGERLAHAVDEPDLVARCREVRARALTDRADWHAGRDAYEDARRAYTRTQDPLGIATCELGLGWVACSEGNLDLAEAHIRNGLEAAERLGAQSQMGTAFNMLGEVARARGAIEEAAAHYRRALALHDSCGATASATIAELNLSIVLASTDRTREARGGVTHRLRTMTALGHEQLAVAARLVLLVCDAQEGRWPGWLDRLQEVATALARSGQAHEDLALLAEMAASNASRMSREREAAASRALAQEQRERLESRTRRSRPPAQ